MQILLLYIKSKLIIIQNYISKLHKIKNYFNEYKIF